MGLARRRRLATLVLVGAAALAATSALAAASIADGRGGTPGATADRVAPGPMYGPGLPAPHPALGEAVCASGDEVDVLTTMTSDHRLFRGADYQRAFALPDGRWFWIFQDVFVDTGSGTKLLHHGGLVQSRNCFQRFVGEEDGQVVEPMFAARTTPERHWFWPLGGGMGQDGRLHVFFAEMIENGDRYLTHVEPIATWLVTIDIDTMSVVSQRPAPDSSAALYGFSVAHGAGWTYLYAQCHRQFGWDVFPFSSPPVYVHDWDCAPRVTVARVPGGRYDLPPQYWDGQGWVNDPSRAVPVIPTAGRIVNPTQVISDRHGFVAVTKVGDWWGDEIVVDVAPAAEGPWRTVARHPVAEPCPDCATYFASIFPSEPKADSLLIGLSTNTWTGYDLDHYHPTFFRILRPV